MLNVVNGKILRDAINSSTSCSFLFVLNESLEVY